MSDTIDRVSNRGGQRATRAAAAAAIAVGLTTVGVLLVTRDGDDPPPTARAGFVDPIAPATMATPTSTAPAPPATAAPATTRPSTTPPSTTPSNTPASAATSAPPTAADAPALVPAAPTTAAPTTLPELETGPIQPPSDPDAPEPVIELGRITIPAIGVDMPMYEGIRNATLDLGPGHWPGSAMPGSGGNVVVGGHRTSKHGVFRHVDQLVAGDEIVFVGGDGAQHVYVVNRIEVVDPTAVWIVEPTDTPQATLFACHPPGSTRERIVVFSDYRETILP